MAVEKQSLGVGKQTPHARYKNEQNTNKNKQLPPQVALGHIVAGPLVQ
jgi:hypothetical protein